MSCVVYHQKVYVKERTQRTTQLILSKKLDVDHVTDNRSPIVYQNNNSLFRTLDPHSFIPYLRVRVTTTS